MITKPGTVLEKANIWLRLQTVEHSICSSVSFPLSNGLLTQKFLFSPDPTRRRIFMLSSSLSLPVLSGRCGGDAKSAGIQADEVLSNPDVPGALTADLPKHTSVPDDRREQQRRKHRLLLHFPNRPAVQRVRLDDASWVDV